MMVGYPGAGKTTVSKIIHELTGAVHLWADHERRQMFANPTHSHEENLKLYDHLNKVAEDLLAEGKSVIFDTNFNFFKDRDHMRNIASRQDAKCRLVWLTTPKETAKQRATLESHGKETRVFGNMLEQDFERMSRNLQPPRDNEKPIKIDGTSLTKEKVQKLLEEI